VPPRRISPRARRTTTKNDTAAQASVATHIADADLIRGIQADDLDMFEAFYERHRAFVFRTAFGLTGDREFAEEVLQDTFVRAYRYRAKLIGDRSPLPWLNRVALNLCYSAHGRRRVSAHSMDDATSEGLRDHGIEPAEWAEQQELNRWVRDGLAALAPKHRSVIVLYYLDGLSLQETSAALGVRLGTVKSRLHYGLRALRHQLASETSVTADGPAAAAARVERPVRPRRR
jgi:RNA polymerase sigma-70 factor (ECF subfamily)